MSLLFAFHFGSKVSWILFTFHVRKDVNKERITTCHSSLHFTLGKITIDQYHIITFDQFNIITLTVTESFSANQCRQDQWTVRFGVPRHVILNLSMSTIKLTLLERDIQVLFTSQILTVGTRHPPSCFWHWPTSDPLQCCKRFLPPCM